MNFRRSLFMLAIIVFAFIHPESSQATPLAPRSPGGVLSANLTYPRFFLHDINDIMQDETPAVPTPTPIPIPPQLETSQTRSLIWLAVLLVILFLLGIWIGIRRTE